MALPFLINVPFLFKNLIYFISETIFQKNPWDWELCCETVRNEKNLEIHRRQEESESWQVRVWFLLSTLLHVHVSGGYQCTCIRWMTLSTGACTVASVFKVAENSFQHFPRRRFWWVIITTLYQLMLQSWYQKTAQSLVNTLVLFLWHYRLP